MCLLTSCHSFLLFTLLTLVIQDRELSLLLEALLAYEEIHDVLSTPIPSASLIAKDAETVHAFYIKILKQHMTNKTRRWKSPSRPETLVSNTLDLEMLLPVIIWDPEEMLFDKIVLNNNVNSCTSLLRFHEINVLLPLLVACQCQFTQVWHVKHLHANSTFCFILITVMFQPQFIGRVFEPMFTKQAFPKHLSKKELNF